MRLAHRSLSFSTVMALSTIACVDAPPTYTAPVRSPPIVLGNQVDPPTVSVRTVRLQATPPTIVSLKVPFRSVDIGEPLIAIIWADYDPSGTQTEKNRHVLAGPPIAADPRPLDEQDRAVTYDWDATPYPGCHTVTMHLAHATTYPSPLEPPTDQDDIGQVTWFFDVQDPSKPPTAACWSSAAQ